LFIAPDAIPFPAIMVSDPSLPAIFFFHDKLGTHKKSC
jgi:hypothetical protein